MLLLALSFVLLVNNPKNKFTYKFLLILFSFALVIVVNLTLSSKQFSYQYTGNPLYSLDYKIYMLLLSMKLNYYFLVKLAHFSYVLYAAACMTFISDFLPRHLRWRTAIITLSVCGVYYLIQLPSVNIWVYQFVYYNECISSSCFILWNLIRNLSALALTVCLYANNVILFNSYCSTSIWLRKWQILTYNIYLLSLNMLFLLFISQNLLWDFDTIKISEMLLSFAGSSYVFSSRLYIFLGMFILFISGFMIFSVFHYKTFGSIIKLRSFFLNKSALKTKKQLRTYFHSFKNHLLTVQSLSEQGLNAETGKQKDELLKSILTLSKNEMCDISTMLDSFNQIDLNKSSDDIIGCLEASIASTNLPDNIRIIRQYNTKDIIMIDFDFYYMAEMFKNIFSNAADAIRAAGRNDGTITIALNSDRDILDISISDNGVGMDAKTRRHMFKPMFTTKVKKDYWGVGMFYAHKVITSHGGFIRVLSAPNKGTQISIFLSVKDKTKN